MSDYEVELCAALDLLADVGQVGAYMDINEPHIVLTVDPESGTTQAYGIYPDGHAAHADLPRLRKEWLRAIGSPMGIFLPVAFFPLDEEPQS